MEITEVRVKLTPAKKAKLRAFCSITIDHNFVIRDLKVIEGSKGAFVAMPSRKLMSRCGCGSKNHWQARFCNECGRRLEQDSALLDGRRKLHTDVAHPINSECREFIQEHVLECYRDELERAKSPDYRPQPDFEDEYLDDDELAANDGGRAVGVLGGDGEEPYVVAAESEWESDGEGESSGAVDAPETVPTSAAGETELRDRGVDDAQRSAGCSRTGRGDSDRRRSRSRLSRSRRSGSSDGGNRWKPEDSSSEQRPGARGLPREERPPSRIESRKREDTTRSSSESEFDDSIDRVSQHGRDHDRRAEHRPDRRRDVPGGRRFAEEHDAEPEDNFGAGLFS